MIDAFFSLRSQLGQSQNKLVSVNEMIICVCEYIKVTHFVEKPSTFVSTLISCGIYLFSPELFDHIGSVFRRNQEDVTYV